MARIKGGLLVFVFLLFLSLEALSANEDWEGIWDDSCSSGDCYGGRLITCVSGNEIYGTYSNIGYIVGKIYGNRAIGMWYESGFSLYNHGGFDWTLYENTGISGTWWYEDNKCLRNGWITPIINSTLENDACEKIRTELRGSIEGEWVTETGDVLSICRASNGYYQGSGNIFGNEVYVTGKYFENENIASGNFWTSLLPYNYNYENNNENNDTNSGNFINDNQPTLDYSNYYDYSTIPQGITLMYINRNNDLIVFYWGVTTASEAINSFDNFAIHTTLTFSSVQNVTSFCSQYENNINQLTWSGVYTDEEYGGYLYICPTVDNRVQGIYSEIGWIDGVIQGNKLYGNWFSAGDRKQDRGNFVLNLSNNRLLLQGYYTNEANNLQNTWRAARLDVSSSNYQDRCLIIPEDDADDDDYSVEGQWYYGKAPGDTFDICFVGENEVEVSYSYNNGRAIGYARGFVSKGKSIQLKWDEKNSNGVAIYRLTSDNRLVESFWAGTDIEYAVCDDDELNLQYWGRHSVNHLIRITDVGNTKECRRYRYANFSSSDASLLSLSLFAVLLGFLLFL